MISPCFLKRFSGGPFALPSHIVERRAGIRQLVKENFLLDHLTSCEAAVRAKPKVRLCDGNYIVTHLSQPEGLRWGVK